MPYKVARDVELPISKGSAPGSMMCPQAEGGGKRLDSLDPDIFKYALTA
jgi:hypothetical protein